LNNRLLPNFRTMIRQLLLSVIILVLFSVGAFRVWAGTSGLEDPFQNAFIKATVVDTIPPLEERQGDFLTDPSTNPFDLSDPEAVEQTIEYDPATGQYIVTEKIGETLFRPPTYISFDEYMELTRQRDQQRFFDNLGGFNYGSGLSVDDPLAGIDVKSSLVDRLFGGTEISIQPQGSIDLTFGFDYQYVDNPILPIRQKRQAGFDFDMAIQMNVTGQIGEKLKLSTNYSTQSSFNFDNQIKLDFNSDAFGEDDILKKIEAGDVSLPLRGQLIQGAQSLFGLKTELQFGHLRITAIASQQKSENESITIEGGSQVTEFEVKSDDYDENRHFFLSHYNRDIYEEALTNLPQIKTLFSIDPQDIEVWVTNDRNEVENTRDIIAFADLGEPVRFTNPDRIESNLDNLTSEYREICNGRPLPDNRANTLMDKLDANKAWENIDRTVSVLTSSEFGLVQSRDFEKVRARKLTAREYTVHPQLGFISLNIPLQPDQVLAVSYDYQYHSNDFSIGVRSSSYGETSTDTLESSTVLVTKMLKSTTQRTDTPSWDLMMKNIYSIGAYQVNREDFRLDVYYEDPGKGVKRFLPTTNLAGQPLIDVFNLDRLNVQGDPQPDGIFDFVPGVTINPNNGRIIFPALEPFGSFLGEQINSQDARDSLVYNELYTKTKFLARENPEKNRFVIKGSYKSSITSEISLGAFNIPQGSVTVRGGGRVLDENVDYEIDYSTGRIRILNDALLSSGTPINVSFEDNTVFGLQNKTMVGIRADYELGDNMNIGATYLNLFERPFTPKVNAGDDPINNRIYGLDFTVNKEVPWLTRAVDKLPFYSTTAPSSVSFLAETAVIDPGHSKAINQSKKDKAGIVYVDDFEGSASTIDISQPTNQWYLASVPKNKNSDRFPESERDDIIPGVNRARLNWYRIDNITRNGTDRANPYTSLIPQQELFPNRNVQPTSQLAGGLRSFDLSFYPNERGPYNYDPPQGIAGISSGASPNTLDTITPVKLNDPKTRWGGIMRAITTNDFQSANIEFLEFWMLSPFQDPANPNTAAPDVRKKEGTLYFNFGNISEDILQDSRRFFENGLPGPNTPNRRVDGTAWGKVPRGQQITNSFDLTEGARSAQDVGLDGLNDREEAIRFKTYIDAMQNAIPGGVSLPALVSDPAGDNFTYYGDPNFSGNDGVLTRYKRFNNVQGNSGADRGNTGGIRQAGTNIPDSEDLDRDNTLNETEAYFEYKIPLYSDPLDPKAIDQENTPFITDKRTDITTGRIWYRFRIPLKGEKNREAVGGIEDFRSIRFMRMYLQGFEAPVTLRFATLDLVRNQWRAYTKALQENGSNGSSECAETVQIDAVSIEENSSKTPFNYTLPEGIQREQSLGVFNQLQNEQSLALRIDNLCDGDAKAVFKYTEIDMRFYERLQLFTHAEDRKEAGAEELKDDDLSMFIRLGSDFTNNYYEYEIPLKVSREDVVIDTRTNSSAYKAEVWRKENQLNFPLDILKNLKIDRNNSDASFSTEFSQNYTSDDGGQHRISVKGNPNLGFVKVMMIGIRNPKTGDEPTGASHSIELWANELRLTGLDERLGMAAIGRMDVQLADLASVTVAGNYNSVGYGALDASVLERSRERVTGYDLSANIELGKFLPKNWGIRLPLYAQKSNTTVTPEYDPYDLDITLKEKLANEPDKAIREEIKAQAQEIVNVTTYNFTNVRKERTGGSGDKPKPWDIENFSGNYGYTKTETASPLIELDVREEYSGGLDYTFSRSTKYIQPFKGIKSKNLKLIKEINLNPLPNSFSMSTAIDRDFAATTYRFADFSPEYKTYFNKRFLWSRNYDLNWDLTRSMKFNFNAAADAVIDEPDEKEIIEDPNITDVDQFRKDSIWTNIRNLGRPKLYRHSISLSYTLPIRYLPYMDWVQVRAQYQAGYTWNAAALNVDSLGNTIMNNQNRQITADLNFEKLYNKSAFLKKINRPSRSSRSSSRTSGRKNGKSDGEEDKKTSGKQDRRNKNNVSPIARAIIRPLMLVRKVKVSYNEQFQTVIPGFLPDSKLLGLSSGFDAPGWGFVAGIQPKIRELNETWGGSDDWLSNAANKGWITSNTFLNAKVIQDYTQSIDGNLILEPFKDFRIDIDARRSFRQDYTENFQVFDKPMPGEPIGLFEHGAPDYSGELSVSYNALKTFFQSSDKELIALFSKFESYRPVVSQRLGTGLHQDPILAALGYTNGYGRDQKEVLLPAFVAAYTDQDPKTIDLNMFNTSFVPNWRVTYNGLAKLKPFNKIFSSFNISHSYKATFRINNYYTNKRNRAAKSNPDRNQQNTSSFDFFPRFEIPNVVIDESFAPLLAIDVQLLNGMSFNTEYKQSRLLSFSTVNNLLTVTQSKEMVAGFGYVLHGVNIAFLTGKKNNRRRRDKEEEEEEETTPGRGGRGRQGRSGGRLGSNDLDIQFNFSFKEDITVAQTLDQGIFEPTRGSLALSISPSVEYQLNKNLSLRAFVDYRTTTPKTSNGFPRTDAAGGVVVRFQLN